MEGSSNCDRNPSLAIAIPTCSSRREDIRIGYVLAALALQQPSTHFDSLEIYIWDEGIVPMTSDRYVQLAMDLLLRRGHTPNYLRRAPSQGVAMARRSLLTAVDERHDRILLIDDDLLVMPGALDALLKTASMVGRYGFIQGTKIELDAARTYFNDINQLTTHEEGVQPSRLWFGDAAFLLVHRPALRHVDWGIVTRYSEKFLPGEDVAMTLMISDKEPCFGIGEAVGYHMSLSTPRWRWEVPSDLLQLELLRPVVSTETLERALPHLARYLRNEDGKVPSTPEEDVPVRPSDRA